MLRQGRLVKVAERFMSESRSMMSTKASEFKIIAGHEVLSLLPNDYVSKDGHRRVVPLSSPEAFREQAEALDICLSRNPDYLTRCRQGKAYILAVVDQASGKPLTTAEISVVENYRTGLWDLQLTSHTGLRNTEVDPESARAVDEVLASCNRLEHQESIGRGQTMLLRGRRRGAAWGRVKAEMAGLAPVLKLVIGPLPIESALKRALEEAKLAFKCSGEVDINVDAPYPANVLSPLHRHPFVFDEVVCGSTEGVLQSLSFSNPEAQKNICRLWGNTATELGNAERKGLFVPTLRWKGIQIDRHDQAYQAFVDKLYLALSDQCVEFREGLNATGDARLVYSAGRTAASGRTLLTESELCSRLLRLRSHNSSKNC